jgi:hypothetical protein
MDMGGGWVLGLDEGYVPLGIKRVSLALRGKVIKSGVLFDSSSSELAI